MSNAGSMPLLRRDGGDPLQGARPGSKAGPDGLITERHNRASQGLLAVEMVLFLLMLAFLSYGESIPIGP